ncbi:MAG TPA: hypothetical protein VFC17_02595 [Candidatus Limnocylindrales bacterium]|nr:hypothetical protein [Candidatus Limnocylindrales bacterium]
MTSKEMRKASEWAKQQRKSVEFELPDRQPQEPRATQKQLDYIRSMVRGLDENTLNSLGKWQASALIDQAKSERAIFTQEKVSEYRRHRGLKSFFSIVIIVAVIWILWKMTNK